MTDPIDWHEPTDEEKEAIERAGLKAAWRELQPLLDDHIDGPVEILAAIKANGFSSRCLRWRSLAMALALCAAQTRWKPSNPLIASISPAMIRYTVCSITSVTVKTAPCESW